MNTATPREKILIVDDEPSNIWSLIRSLESDYEILSATSGEKALNIAVSTPTLDLILLDIVMPGMDGYEVCSRLKENETSKDIPVIFLTANLDDKSEIKGLELGAVDYIKKPFSLIVVKARVKSVLDLKREVDKRAFLQSHLTELNDHLEESIKLKRIELKKTQDTLRQYEDKYNRLYPKKRKNKGRSTILVVDDTPENIHILTRNLEDKYEVYCASNGDKALEIAFSDNPPDLFLLDIMMPDMDGYELCSRLKSNPGTRDIPVIFVTAMNQEFDETKGLNLGAMDYITKPFSIPVVEARVATALRLKNTMDYRTILTQRLEQLNSDLEQNVKEKIEVLAYTQQALKHSEKKYRAIFESAIEGIFQSTIEGSMLNVNSSLAQILGYSSPVELMEQVTNTRQFYSKPEDRENFIKILKMNKQVDGFETELKKSNGELVWVSLSAKEIRDGPDVTHIQGFLTDITARKQAHWALEKLNQELENRVKERTKELELSLSYLKLSQIQLVESEKMASLGNLLAGMAHEINTPLGVLLTALSYLQEEFEKFASHYYEGNVSQQDIESLLEKGTKTFTISLLNTDKIIELISTFKELAIDTRDETKSTFDLTEYLLLLVHSFSGKLKQQGVHCELTGINKLQITTYHYIFSTLLRHLLENSMRHGFKNKVGGNIQINCGIKENWVIIDYHDDGIGIAAEIQGKLFEPFFTTERSAGYSGLGLHIICNLVNQGLKGQIECLPASQGATFRISFPLTG